MLYENEVIERYEYWNGEKIMMTPNSMEHEFVLSNLTLIVNSFVRKHKLGRVFANNIALYLHGNLTQKDFRLADLSFVKSERLDIVQSKGIFGPPDLIVEILSPGKENTNRDRVEKYELYEKYAVHEYWIVNPYEEEVEIYSLKDGEYVRKGNSIVLDGIELARKDIFE
jgi:Uma2 family endonuclease